MTERRGASHQRVPWWLVGVLAALCAQSLLVPFELFHSYSLSIHSIWACLVFSTRDSDIFVPRVWLPYPVLIALVFAIPAGQRLRARWLAPRPGRCPACGYDLRATPDRCPECGRDGGRVE